MYPYTSQVESWLIAGRPYISLYDSVAYYSIALCFIHWIAMFYVYNCRYPLEVLFVSASSLFESSDVVSVTGDRRRCPVKGRYTIHTGASHCRSYFRSNCNDDDVVDIVSTCSSRPGLSLNRSLVWLYNILKPI